MIKKMQVFGSIECALCAEMYPIIEDLVDEGFNIEVFRAEENDALFAIEEIHTFPTIKFYVNNQIYTQTIGVVPKHDLMLIYNRDMTQERSDEELTPYEVPVSGCGCNH